MLRRDSVPKTYRPYLGPNASQEEVDKRKYENTRVNLRKYYKRQQRASAHHDGPGDDGKWSLIPHSWKRKKSGKKHKKSGSLKQGKPLSAG